VPAITKLCNALERKQERKRHPMRDKDTRANALGEVVAQGLEAGDGRVATAASAELSRLEGQYEPERRVEEHIVHVMARYGGMEGLDAQLALESEELAKLERKQGAIGRGTTPPGDPKTLKEGDLTPSKKNNDPLTASKPADAEVLPDDDDSDS
jgi:hypothetical protein